jgi:hypothetical protein
MLNGTSMISTRKIRNEMRLPASQPLPRSLRPPARASYWMVGDVGSGAPARSRS